MTSAHPQFVIIGVLLVLTWHPIAGSVCPPGSAWNLEDAFGFRDSEAYLQRGVKHQVPCPTLGASESLDGVIWYKESSTDDPSKARLISRDLRDGNPKDSPTSERYSMASNQSLVIEGVEDRDEGGYLCQVLPSLTYPRVGQLLLRVIGDMFPASRSEASSTATFHRHRRQTLPCECASQTPDVVYWSTGEGDTTDTQIIGARFSDGATLQVQHGADYSIGSDASLTVNSLEDVLDTKRIWCHVFQSDGTLRHCYIDVKISDEGKSADALMASDSSFYLRKDTQQILPCPSWTPGDTACEMEWSRPDNPDRQVLNYNLSTGAVDSSPGFNLSSDFGLVIQSADDDHAGVYRCAVGGEHQTDVEVRVIGDRFPLDEGSATEGDSVTFELNTRFSLQCPALSNISLTTKATLFWSSASPDAESATLIGTLNLPDGPMEIADLGKDCLGISMEGALLFNNCTQDGDVRYWCHVFPANDDLIRSYTDVLIDKSSGDPDEKHKTVAIAVCVSLVLIALLVIILFLLWKRLRKSTRDTGDRERGRYKQVQKTVLHLNMKTLIDKVKRFVTSKWSRVPITPLVDQGGACFASLDTVYRPLEMLANVSYGGSTVKYPLDSGSGIFDDGIPELAGKHVIIQGRQGCGKTTFLHKVIYDWANGTGHALWGGDQMVVLVPARLLIKAKTIGTAVVECMLPEDANISAESINAHYARDKSNLTILVDDCNDKDDIDAVMKVMTDNDLLDCQLVMTTRNPQLAKDASTNHKMRHVTINGFSLKNAIEYINVVLNTTEDSTEAIPENKADKSKAETRSGLTSDSDTEQHTAKKQSTERKRYLCRYLEDHILPADLACLPAVLTALCQLSVWTKGDEFKPSVTMAKLFLRLVMFMFKENKSREGVITESDQVSTPTKDQLDVLTELGRVAFSRSIDIVHNFGDFSKDDFLSSTGKAQHVLEVALNHGLLKSAEQNDETVSGASEVVVRTGCLCCERKQKQHDAETELTPLKGPQDERVFFVLEILEQICVAQFLAMNMKTATAELVNEGTRNTPRDILQEFPYTFQFVVQSDEFDKEDLIKGFAKIIHMRYNRARPLHVVMHLQKFVEMCLQLNFEGQWKGTLNKKLKSIFPEGRVRLVGISSYKLRLLSYLLQHACPEDNQSKLNVKSVELLRIGKCQWSEIKECIDCFVSGQKGPETITVVKSGQQAADGIPHGPDPQNENPLNALLHILNIPHPKYEDDDSAPSNTETRPRGQFNEDESRDIVRRKLRERVEASSQDMPEFPTDDSDIHVLDTVQSFGLQELLDSQAGECFSSHAARDLARCLPRLEKLEDLVLVGTILSSEAICDFAKNADKLSNLKKLDLRLNRQFDDRAFVAVTNLPLRECKHLMDLRLSLYEVGETGFGEVLKRMEEGNGASWGRLKTLYLLHGSPAETFVTFLSNSLRFLHFVEAFHLSAANQSEGIKNETQEKFENTISDSMIMPNLTDLDIGNMETLKARLTYLKLPKKKAPQMQEKDGHWNRGLRDVLSQTLSRSVPW